MIAGMFEGGALPVLEKVVQFTASRQRLLAHNIANLSTPGFVPTDMDPESFQAALADAIDQRRSSGEPLQVSVPAPEALNQNILFHDQNNRDLERTMAALAENAMTHNAALEMIRNEFEMLRLAIRERM